MTPEHKDANMLKSLRLKNFKSYRDSGAVPLSPLTVIVGCNNAGKSTLLQSLILLSQTIRDPSYTARLVTRGDVDLGSFYDIIHRKDQQSSQVVSIEVARDIESPVFAPEESDFSESTKIALQFSFNRRANKIQVRRVEFADEQGVLFHARESGDWWYRGVAERTANRVKVQLRNFLPRATVPKEGNNRFSKAGMKAFDAMMSIEMQTHSWLHVFYGMNRVPPHRSHVPFYGGLGERESSRADIGESLLRIISSDDQINNSGTLLKSVNYWMRHFGAITNIRVKKLDAAGHFRSLIADDFSGSTKGVNIAAMGEGISQLLPIIDSVVRGVEYGCVLIEQPEIHLHPKLQADIADLFISAVKTEKRQLVIETHSEHLLLRLRRRIAEGKLSADKVSILYVEQRDGESKVRQLKLNGRGHFDEWPEGFFDEAYNEAMKLAMAQPSRQENARTDD